MDLGNGKTLKVATYDDIPFLLPLLEEALKESPYKDFGFNKDNIVQALTHMLSASNTNLILLMCSPNPVGVLIATKSDISPFFTVSIATELLWWVHPDYRNDPRNIKMLGAFEYWAKTVGCQRVTMVTLENELQPSIERLYLKRGYKKIETTYTKVL